MELFNEISVMLQQGRAKNVKELVQQALDQGIPAIEILEKGLIQGMNIIGEKFKTGEVFVPEVLIAARAMNTAMEVLKPVLVSAGVQAKGKVVIGTVEGDMHDIGKNLVKMMMEGRGLEVIDLGINVPAQRFIDEAIKHGAKVIACSALLTTTMNQMKNVVAAAEAAQVRDKVKIMIGGAPVTQEFCDAIGADAYTSDAATAAQVAESFFG